jgi:hypothetical protein
MAKKFQILIRNLRNTQVLKTFTFQKRKKHYILGPSDTYSVSLWEKNETIFDETLLDFNL